MKLFKEFIMFAIVLVESRVFSEVCHSSPCVLSSASIIRKLNTKIDPCDDFYDFACGSFFEDVVTPDEESTVDSLSLMGDKLQEFLLTLLSSPVDSSEPENHKLVKLFYQSCINYDKVNARGNAPLIDVLKYIGGFPMIEDEWNETEWQWENSILKLRYYISKRSNNIFGKTQNTPIISEDNNLQSKQDFARIESSLKNLIRNIALILGAKNDEQLDGDIENLIEFEKKLGYHLRKFNFFKKRRNPGVKPIEEFQKMHRLLIWMELFAANILSDNSIGDEDIPNNFNVIFYEFLKNTPKRTLANYVSWRVIQASVFLMGEEMRQISLDFETAAYGKEDFEQRWKLCTSLVTDKAAVAVGQYYINEFFSEYDKSYAEQMVEEILYEYKQRIRNSDWMDEITKENALNITNSMLKFIGYHENIKSKEADNYYNDLYKWNEDYFFEMTLSFLITITDKEYNRLHTKPLDKQADWMRYSKPATVNAFYNSKDNSIQFPSAILQFPFFDRLRPDSLNFGGIGSIIGHEITHAFDDLSSKLNTWSEQSRSIYKNNIDCLIEQYNRYRVPEVEKYFNISEFYVNGNRTIKENVADNGGVKLALLALRKRLNNLEDIELIGLDSYSNEKLFFLSFAQTFCSVERPAKMKSNTETLPHPLSKFRVIGALSNMPEFSITWNCSSSSRMNPEMKCALW